MFMTNIKDFLLEFCYFWPRESATKRFKDKLQFVVNLCAPIRYWIISTIQNPVFCSQQFFNPPTTAARPNLNAFGFLTIDNGLVVKQFGFSWDFGQISTSEIRTIELNKPFLVRFIA